MFVRNLSTSAKLTQIASDQAIVANTASNTLIGVDMAGFQSVLFIMSTATGKSAAQGPVLSAQASDAWNSTAKTLNSPTVIANSSVGMGANTLIAVLEIARPAAGRYVAPVVTGGTANSTVEVIAIQLGREPPTRDMVPQNPAFNTTTGTFPGVANMKSNSNTPVSVVILANP